MPLPWMDAVHRRLSLGPLPAGPVVEYLARSLSGFYATHGALLWFVSLDVRRYRPWIEFLGWIMLAGGAAVLVLDATAGMPAFWTALEGPAVSLQGLAVTILARRTRRPPQAASPRTS